ncbi:hypothetical protein KOAAANKH_02559 [Brevundimonas sp. NIBR10]|uniref:RusA family crossover junction endodeoxyribonuclease n=1 Tax=Brevundimonas sp. NIBR10 TaxID=3015997 RepID=UPI0022F16FB8|nr:RusA family crossover junction endodeoxyribonuclease [Brevundimonas sp. NIBR10]WGM47677.1 hypothetical protein KOAAANKH_02559 [Brevundimonas sp. NIBR10]
MTLICAFTYYGKSVPKMRAGRNGVQSFTPKRNAAFEAKIRAIAAVEMARSGMQTTPDACVATMAFDREMPKSWSKAKKLALRGEPIVGRPDIDNQVKAILDALNEIVWEDDAQVSDLHTSRRWAETDSVRISISLATGPGVLAEAA